MSSGRLGCRRLCAEQWCHQGRRCRVGLGGGVEGALEQVLEGGVGVEGALEVSVVAVGDGFGVGGWVRAR